MAQNASRFAAAAVKVDADRVERERVAEEKRRLLVQCKVCKFLRDEPEIDTAYISAMLNDDLVSNSYIAEVLTAGGVPVGKSSIKRHRLNHQGQ